MTISATSNALPSSHTQAALQGAFDFLNFKKFKLVAGLNILIAFQADAALVALANFVGIILEALQGFHAACMDDHIVPQYSNFRATAG
jgi:hypothetical protein